MIKIQLFERTIVVLKKSKTSLTTSKAKSFNLRTLLLPFSWIYGSITALRNLLFDTEIFKVYKIPVKSICVGNLAVGGTGKTPHVDLIAKHFINQGKKVVILSRGYGRGTKGLLEVQTTSNASEVGDEPLFYKLKYKEEVKVVVAEKRKIGVKYIMSNFPETDLILLDDAFQHRAVKAGLNIIITDYSNLYSNDFVLPAGNLREFSVGKKRADIVIVSKCPNELNDENKAGIIKQLKFKNDAVFFSKIEYDELITFTETKEISAKRAVLVTGIANPIPLLNRLKETFQIEHVKFSDHHVFKASEIEIIQQKIDIFAPEDGIVITTEKDFMRLKDFDQISNSKNNWYYQSISTKIDELEKFNLLIENYVNEI